jgi:hypothetical protein
MRLAWLAAVLVPSAALAQPADPAPSPPPAGGPPGTTVPTLRPEPDSSDFAKPRAAGKDIVITVPGERSHHNILVLSSIAGAGALLGAVGLYFNLDARSAANDVNADQAQHVPWTPALQSKYDQAHDSSVKAGVFYGLGGAVVIGAIVGLIITTPKDTTTVIHPHTALIAPTPGGAVVGTAWSF